LTLAPAPPFETDALPEAEPAAVVCAYAGAASIANASNIVANAFIYLFSCKQLNPETLNLDARSLVCVYSVYVPFCTVLRRKVTLDASPAVVI
jgi:hypothetical protein